MSQKIAGKGSLALALSLALGLSGVARAEVRIGVAGPHTGPSAAIGEQYWRGASQAAADINAAGGINGQQVALIKGDDACEPKQAVAVANRLVGLDWSRFNVSHGGGLHYFCDGFINGVRLNIVGDVIILLNLAAAADFFDDFAHRFGDFIGVKDNPTVDIARRPTRNLHQRFLGTQKSSLSASKIATNDTSGKSRPSRRRLMPTSTSKFPSRKSRKMLTRSRALISECK